ncbi:hypothetical protein Lsai_2821 [Legionella sainthelensi]|uniref:Uncharacterized protein n=2 Tax=Legionella sainthelensi TaxID=28087 RepID=A0A0W0YE82_9GAMM|nr:hypothetical protein [Legionella sainthelensi]KTD55229.1 hypothetical protein Lsai_2821 [Legionella sainthelensi]
MPYTEEMHKSIMELAEQQKKAIDTSHNLYYSFRKDRYKFSYEIDHDSHLDVLREQNICLDNNQFFVYLKHNGENSNDLKLHIPLKQGPENGLLVANVINQLNIGIVGAIKAVNPNIGNLGVAIDEESKLRATTGAAITIYFKDNATSEEIAQAIYHINKRLEEVNRLYPINVGKTAHSDKKITPFVSVTIDKNGSSYIDASTSKGVAARQQLLSKSIQLKEIEKILPLYNTLEKIDDYISNREKLGTYTSKFSQFKFLYSAIITPFTKTQKLDAANALREVILGRATADTLLEHLDALNERNSNLKKVFDFVMKEHPQLSNDLKASEQCIKP